MPKLTNAEINTLQQVAGTPLEYVLTPDPPMVQTALGHVQLGSVLSYQVKIILYINFKKIKFNIIFILPKDHKLTTCTWNNEIYQICIWLERSVFQFVLLYTCTWEQDPLSTSEQDPLSTSEQDPLSTSGLALSTSTHLFNCIFNKHVLE